ncbi:MAG TPA: universal stress protein [Ktedonobacteraceae bacterium]|nr:universal stress protein [Ktedonobacteraceae bacterium]
MFQRVLVPLDGSKRAEQAIPIAARMARATGGSIILARVVLPPVESGKFAAPSSIAWERRAFAAQHAEAASYLVNTMFTHSAQLTGIEVEMGVATGLLAPSVVSVARSQEADLIIMCSHGEKGLKRWFFGSVAQEIMRLSPFPMLILHEQGARFAFHTDHCLRALVILDDSPQSRAVLEPAARLLASLAAPTQGVLHLQRVLDLSSTEGLWHNPSIDKIWREAETSLRMAAHELRSFPAASRLTITTAVTTGSSMVEAIMQQAECAMKAGQAGMDSFDLIALSMQRQKGLFRLFKSSAAERLLGATTLPLLIIPSSMETGFTHSR